MHIQASHLSKSFGGQDILKDVSFTLNDGDRVALVGKNGSGKSTIFKIVMGDEEPDQGHINISPKSSRIGYLPQVIDDDTPLSSGQKTKLRLQEILASHPDALILDEPTNHLDWSGMVWLEEILKTFTGPVLMVSHDRYFLDRTADKIISLDDGRVGIYGGNYSFYKQQKQIQEEANLRDYVEQNKRINKLKRQAAQMKNQTQEVEISTTGTDHYVRRKAAKSARSALSIEKRIQKELEETSITKPEPNWELRALFKPAQESSQTVVRISSLNYKNIIEDLSLVIQRGQRLAILGDNGSGKSTLLKLILGQLAPESGEVVLGNGVTIGYLSQDHQELDDQRVVLDELTSAHADKTQSYKLLRRFLITPDKINQPVKFLSSGEKSKLLLAKIMTNGSNFIILDEPTNHLDIPSREAIEESLANYTGTLLVVSHDRYFLGRIGITNYYQIPLDS